MKYTLQLLNENRRNFPDLAAVEEGAAAVTDAEVESDAADSELEGVGLEDADLDDAEERDG